LHDALPICRSGSRLASVLLTAQLPSATRSRPRPSQVNGLPIPRVLFLPPAAGDAPAAAASPLVSRKSGVESGAPWIDVSRVRGAARQRRHTAHGRWAVPSRGSALMRGGDDMRAVVWHGVGDIRVEDVDEPTIQDPQDAIVQLTTSAICGTDLHLLRGTIPGMRPGTIM